MAKRIGRRKGSWNKGFFYRTGRGWYIRAGGKYVPLCNPDGEQFIDQHTDKAVLREAAARQLIATVDQPPAASLPVMTADAQVGKVCAAYLNHLKTQAGEIGSRPHGKAKTYVDRGQTLFDFCYGLPGEFFCNGDREARQRKTDAEAKRIHAGFGGKLCFELTPVDVDAWLKAHQWKAGGSRTACRRSSGR